MFLKRIGSTPATPTDNIKESHKYGYGIRHIQLAIFFLCFTAIVIARGHIGVTIVAMTSNPDLNSTIYLANQSNPNTTVDELHYDITSNSSAENSTLNIQNYITWNWPKPIQEMVLHAFFLGYMIMMFPMGMICQRYGGKLPLQIGLCMNGLLSIITPWLTVWGGWKALCCCRLLQGVTQAGTVPSIQNLLAKWVPENELATLTSGVHTGLTFGTVIGLQVGGLLGASKWGWPSTFYAIGVICLIFFILLTIFGEANPLGHKSISDKERNYIMGAANVGKKLRMPWRAILTSKPLYGTIIAHTGGNVAFMLFYNQVPTYIHHTLDIDVKNSGLLSSLPYIATIFTSLLVGWLADYSVNRNIVSKNNTRRIGNSIATGGMAVSLILTSYIRDPIIVMIFLIIAMATMGTTIGWMVNYIDLAPNFSGSIMSIGNTISYVASISMPIVVSYVITDLTNVIQWRIMFFITAGISLTSNVIYVFMMSTDVQPWNYADNKKECENVQEGSIPKTQTVNVS